MNPWLITHQADRRARRLADRHYSRKTPGASHFAPPGRQLVLITERADALWVTSWPYPQYTRHAWPGAWLCSLFRNESAHLSSTLIRQAVAVTLWHWPTPPYLGLITFIDRATIKPKQHPGRCFIEAGFTKARCPLHTVANHACASCRSETKSGLLVLQLLPQAMPAYPSPAAATIQQGLFK